MIGTLIRELIDRLLIINEPHLRQAMTECLQHYNAQPQPCPRPASAHSSGDPPPHINLAEHQIRRTHGLGGLTSENRTAA
jgi:putative transposase